MSKNLVNIIFFTLIGTISIFVFQMLMTHILPPTSFGIFAKWLTDIGYLGMFFVLGLDTSILYYAKLGEKYEENMGKNFLIYTVVFMMCFTIIFIFKLDVKYYLPLFISIISFSITSVFRSYFHFHEEYFWFNFIGIIKPVLILMVFTFFYFCDFKFEIFEILNLYAVISVCVLIIVAIKYFSVSGIIFNRNVFKNFSYFLFGFKSIINKVLSLSLYASTIYCLSFFGEITDVAYFFIASGISKLAWVLPDSAGNLLYPRFLKIGKDYEEKQIINEMIYYINLIFALNIFGVILFYFIGEYLIALLYESSYAIIFTPIIILLIGNQGMVLFKILGRYLTSKNNWKPMYVALVIGILVNVMLNVILIPKIGLIGASIATSLSFLSCGIYMASLIDVKLFQLINVFNVIKK